MGEREGGFFTRLLLGLPSLAPGIIALASPGGRPPIETAQDALQSERRQAIYDMVERQPGISMTDVREALAIAPYPLDQHVKILERVGLIERRRVGRFVRLYLTGKAPEEGDPQLLPESVRQVGLLVLRGVSSSREVAEKMGVDERNVRYALATLREAGLVTQERKGMAVVYRPTSALKKASLAWQRRP